jgi:hypothetical protein
MGIIAPKKVPRTITRKDDPNKVEVYKRGGAVKPKAKNGRQDY